jgi:uncharacterized protein
MGLSPSSLPFLGAGLGYRRAIRAFYRERRDLVGFVEVMPEHLLHAPPEARAALLEDAAPFPAVTHSVSLGLGRATGPDLGFARRSRAVHRRLRAPWTSDHLAFTGIGHRRIGQLTPVPYDDATLQVVVANARAARRALGLPLLLENISSYFAFPGSTMTEAGFLAEACAKSGCGALLDVTNLRNNAHNLGTDPERYLAEFPLERLVQLHLAGSEPVEGRLLDTHGAPIHRESWALARRAVENSSVRALLVERDQAFGSLRRLAGELATAGRLMAGASGA